MRFLVPRCWTGEQALVAAALLREALDAVWDVHGEDMAVALGGVPKERWHQVMPDDDSDDVIPF
jgi:hypothetical protein